MPNPVKSELPTDVKELRAALLEAERRQTATAEILRVIAGSPSDVQPVFDAIAASAMRLIKGQSSAVTRVCGDTIQLVALTSTTPAGDEAVRKFFPVPISHPRSLHAKAVRSGAHAVRIDAETDPNMVPSGREMARARGYRSDLVVPMMRDGAAIGAISVTRSEPGEFDVDQVNLLETFAAQAVIAIENMRLFNETKEALEQQTATAGILRVISESPTDTQPVFDAIVENALRLFDGHGVAILLADGDQVQLGSAGGIIDLQKAREKYPLPLNRETVSGRAIVERQVINIADAQAAGLPEPGRDIAVTLDYHGLTAMPMMRGGEAIGSISVARKSVGGLADKDLALLRTFAHQAVIAIENVRLFKELEARTTALEIASHHKSDFLASMSHELRTPLNAILGFNELILAEIYGPVPEEMKEPLSDIQSSGKHLLRLINNVLDLAKIEAGRMELALADYSVHDTVESVRSTLRPLAAEKGLEFLAVVPDDVPIAYGDFGRITQCLMNLAGNSLKFTKEGKVEIVVEHKAENLVFRVNDTGIGIPPDKIASLFTEFKQTDATIASEYGGTGLGLSISKKFIEMHGGRIWIESELGKGSSFIFEVPVRVSEGAGA